MGKNKGKHREIQRKDGRRDLPIEHQPQFNVPTPHELGHDNSEEYSSENFSGFKKHAPEKTKTKVKPEKLPPKLTEEIDEGREAFFKSLEPAKLMYEKDPARFDKMVLILMRGVEVIKEGKDPKILISQQFEIDNPVGFENGFTKKDVLAPNGGVNWENRNIATLGMYIFNELPYYDIEIAPGKKGFCVYKRKKGSR